RDPAAPVDPRTSRMRRLRLRSPATKCGSAADALFSGCIRCLRCKESSFGSCAVPFRPQGNGKEERAALADLALDPDAAAVHLHEFLGDAEAQARPAELTRHGRVDLAELREHIL